PGGEARNDAIGGMPHVALAFLHEPAGAEQRIAEAEAGAAQQREGAEPAELAADVAPVADGEPHYERPHGDALDERRGKRPAGEARVPDPPKALGLVAELESDAAQDEASQHDQQRKVEGGKQSRIDDGKGAPEDDSGGDQPGLVTVPDRRDGAQHRAPPRLVP